MDDTRNPEEATQGPPLRTGGQVKPDDPLDTPLPCEIVIGHMRFGQGVKLRTLVDAAARFGAQQMRERAAVFVETHFDTDSAALSRRSITSFVADAIRAIPLVMPILAAALLLSHTALACQQVVPSIPESCSGTVVSTRYWGDDGIGLRIVPESSGFLPAGFPKNPLFWKQYDGTFMECKTIFDIYGPKVAGVGGSGDGGSWGQAIAVDGLPTMLIAGPMPEGYDTYASWNFLSGQYLAGWHRVETYLQARYTPSHKVAMSPYSQQWCTEIWMTVQPPATVPDPPSVTK